MSDAITVITLAALAGAAIWAQWCAIRRSEELACKLAAMRDEAGRLYAENMRLRDELEARK